MGIWDDLTGKTAADAAAAAAADQYRKEQQAIAEQRAAGAQAQGDFASAAGLYAPYAGMGQAVNPQILAALGLGGNQAEYTAAYQNLPGYQSGLQTGTQAAIRAANAGGGTNRGAALKQLYRFGSDYENMREGDYYNRLTGQQGLGLQATGSQVGTIGQGINANLGARTSAFGGAMNSAGTIGQGQIAGAQARQGAMTNLLGTGAYVAGQALGGPLGGAASKRLFG